MPANRPKPLALVIMDGYGIAPREDGDAARAVNTSYLDKLISISRISLVSRSN